MAESINLTCTSKEGIYKELLPQIEAVISSETNLIANLANITAMLKEAFGWFWVGFYICDTPSQLVLGPFQGTLACTRIAHGRGVCGTAWSTAQTVVVEDVDKFEGHIACSSLSRSEIVVPIFSGSEVWGVLDVDSDTLASFDNTDKCYLERLAEIISGCIENAN